MRRHALALGVFLLAAAGAAEAIDHKNLDEGRPIRLDDAYTIAAGEIELEIGGGTTVGRRSPARGVVGIEILYGAWPNLQVSLGTRLTTDPRDLDDVPRSGDLRVSALYNVNQETLTLPALGVRLDVGLPTGVEAESVAVKLKGIVTRSVERASFHFNAAYERITDARGDERAGRYELVLGASYPLGAPRYTRATLVADVFAAQALRRGDDTIVGIEAGFRHQVRARWVWDLGVGTEFAGPRDRNRFVFTTGFSFGF